MSARISAGAIFGPGLKPMTVLYAGARRWPTVEKPVVLPAWPVEELLVVAATPNSGELSEFALMVWIAPVEFRALLNPVVVLLLVPPPPPPPVLLLPEELVLEEDTGASWREGPRPGARGEV
jgi:hypothetical protein